MLDWNSLRFRYHLKQGAIFTLNTLDGSDTLKLLLDQKLADRASEFARQDGSSMGMICSHHIDKALAERLEERESL